MRHYVVQWSLLRNMDRALWQKKNTGRSPSGPPCYNLSVSRLFQFVKLARPPCTRDEYQKTCADALTCGDSDARSVSSRHFFLPRFCLLSLIRKRGAPPSTFVRQLRSSSNLS